MVKPVFANLRFPLLTFGAICIFVWVGYSLGSKPSSAEKTTPENVTPTYDLDFKNALSSAAAADKKDELAGFAQNQHRIALTGPPLLHPVRLASDDGKSIAILDNVGQRIALYGPDGSYQRDLGSHGTMPTQYTTAADISYCGGAADNFAIVDFTKRRVLYYAPNGEFKGSFIYTPQNFSGSRISCSTVASTVLLLGNKWTTNPTGERTVELAHNFTLSGDYRGSSLILPPALEKAGLNVTGSPLLATLPSGEMLVAVPYTDEIFQLGANGEASSILPHGATEFRAPEKAPVLVKGEVAKFQSWELSWTPLVAVAANANHIFVEYQTFSPLRYRIDVWNRKSKTLARSFSTNHLLLQSNPDGTAYFLENIDNIGEHKYALIEVNLQ